MAEPQLSARSAKAKDLAHRLARRENRSIADIVERARHRVTRNLNDFAATGLDLMSPWAY
jgi:hypothetical protein